MKRALGVGAIAVTAFAVLVWNFSRISRYSEIQNSKADLDRQLAALKTNPRKGIYLYESKGTDALLRQIEGLEEVEELEFELTDLTDNGVPSLVTLPRLRKLVIYAGLGFTDRGLAALKGAPALETLELTNTRVTNDGLHALRDIPNLHTLTLYCEPRLSRLTDAALVNLRDLTRLKTLHIKGGWASSTAVAELQTHLPHCQITLERQ